MRFADLIFFKLFSVKAKMRPFIFLNNFQNVIRDFTTATLDYCRSLYARAFQARL